MNMNKLKYFVLPILFLVTSCYIYKPYVEKEEDESSTQNERSIRPISLRSELQKKETARLTADAKKKKEKVDSARGKIQSKSQKSVIESKNSIPDMTDGRVTEPKSEKEIESMGVELIDSSVEIGIKDKIRPNQYYKITVEDSQYKIQADQWEGDTLVSHILRKPERVLKFHKDQINEEALLERRFSKPYSDLLTVGSYVTVGVAVLLLVL